MPGNTMRIVATLDDKVSGPLAKIRDNFDRLGKSKGAVSILQGVGIGAGISAYNLLGKAADSAVNFIFDSIQAASDLNETLQKSSVVFGPAAKGIEAWGKSAAQSFGLSEEAAIGAAASIGNLLRSTGTAPSVIAPMSQAIVELAADLASFNNIPIEDALAKLQSGLVGQERPLRELGVAISAASVDAEAFALGFKQVNGVFTEGQKVQARYSLIFKQTGTAQGDFARTADGLANTQRSLNAEVQNLSTEIGTQLLPVARDFSRWILDEGIPALKELLKLGGETTQWVTDLRNALLLGMPSYQEWVAQHQAATLGLTDEQVAALKLNSALVAQHIALMGAVGGTEALGEASRRTSTIVRTRLTVDIDHLTDAIHNFYSAAREKTDWQILQDNLRNDQQALKDLRKEYREGKITLGEYKTRLHELTGAIYDDKTALADHALEQAKLGKSKELTDWVKAARKRWEELTAAEKRAVEEAEKYLYRLKLIRDAAAGGDYKHKASGGPVTAGVAYTVGEAGSETFVPAVSGTIIPHGGWSGGGGGMSVTVNFNSAFAPSVAQAQAAARAIAPELTRELRRQHVL